jgi:hypothetical protein
MSTKSKSKALVAIAALIGTLLFAPSASAFDSTPPTLVSVKVSPTTLPEGGGTVTVTVVVSSPTYGLADPPVIIFTLDGDNSGNRNQGFGRMALVSGDAKHGTYESKVNFTAPLMSGIYRLTIYPLADLAKNTTVGFNSTKATVAIGVVTPTPTVTPAPSATSIPTPPQSDAASQLRALKGQIAALLTENGSLNSQVARLTVENADLTRQVKTLGKIKNHLTKICSVKPRPKSC